MAGLDEQLAKLTKEKKRLEEVNNKTMDSLAQEEEKVKHLQKIKSKLESALDESEESVEREKRDKAELDKAKRRLEGELRSTQAHVEELERVRQDSEEAARHKQAELQNLAGKLEDEHNHVLEAQRKNKELVVRLAEAEDEAENERAGKRVDFDRIFERGKDLNSLKFFLGRVKAEKQRSEISHELDELQDRLEEAGGATTAQLDLNKKRELELTKLRHDLEEANVQHEATATQLRKKHQDAVNEMSQQIEQLQKSKGRLEKEKGGLKSDLDDHKMQTESLAKAKASVEKLVHQLEAQLQEMNVKSDEATRQLNEMSLQKGKLQSENAGLLQQLDEAENQVS